MSTRTIERITAAIIVWAVGFLAATLAIIVTLHGPEAYGAEPLEARYVQPHEPLRPEGRVVPCRLEDGSGKQVLPCYWDASVQGNQVGHSFWIDRREFLHYVSPRLDFLYQRSLKGWSQYRGVKGHGVCVTKNYALACQDGLRRPL